MHFTRREFFKWSAAGAAGLSLGQLGFDLAPVRAYAYAMKIEGTKEIVSTCPFCSCGCQTLMAVKDGKLVSVEGDPDYPVSEGALCPKGASQLSQHLDEHRLQKPKYRAAFSDKWEEKDWDWTLDRIARLVKDTRDRDFIAKNAKGQDVNRWDSVYQFGSASMDNEECAASHQMLRSLGVVYIDHQARV